jgi:hypothetical protein
LDGAHSAGVAMVRHFLELHVPAYLELFDVANLESRPMKLKFVDAAVFL